MLTVYQMSLMATAIAGMDLSVQEFHAALFDTFRSMIFWCLSRGARLVVLHARLPPTVKLVTGQSEDIILTLLTILVIWSVLRPLTKTMSLSFLAARPMPPYNTGAPPALRLAFSALHPLSVLFAILTAETNLSSLPEPLCALILASMATVETTQLTNVCAQLNISTKMLSTFSV